MTPEPFSSPTATVERARYHTRELVQLLGLMLLIYGTQWLVRKPEFSPWLKIVACTLVASTFLGFYVISERRRFSRLDELGRKIALEAYFLAFAVAVTVTFLCSMLKNGELLDVEPVQQTLLILLGYLISLEWSRRRYR